MLWGRLPPRAKGRSVTRDYRRSGHRVSCSTSRTERSRSGLPPSIRRRCGREGSVRLRGQCHGGRVGCARDACESADLPRAEIADVLLDQAILRASATSSRRVLYGTPASSPFARVRDVSDRKLKPHRRRRTTFSFRFLELRRIFALRKNLGRVSGKSCVSPVRWRDSSGACTASGRAAASFARMSGRADQRRSRTPTTLTIRNETCICPSTRCSRPNASSTAARVCAIVRPVWPFELVKGLRPVVLQQLRERAIGEQPAFGLARRAIVHFVLAVYDALHRCAAPRARFAEAAVYGHPFAERRHFFGKRSPASS